MVSIILKKTKANAHQNKGLLGLALYPQKTGNAKRALFLMSCPLEKRE